MNRTRLVTSWTVSYEILKFPNKKGMEFMSSQSCFLVDEIIEADGGKSTGCYNTLYPGFDQVHPTIALGQSFPKVSTYGGDQWECKFPIFLVITFLFFSFS